MSSFGEPFSRHTVFINVIERCNLPSSRWEEVKTYLSAHHRDKKEFSHQDYSDALKHFGYRHQPIDFYRILNDLGDQNVA